MKLVGVDIGGTFTDLIVTDTDEKRIWVHKVPTTDNPSEGMVRGINELCRAAGLEPGSLSHVLHGSTIATNALLQYDGVRTGMITTDGYRDIIHIARHQRPQHYSIMQDVPWQSHSLVKRRFRKVVTERLGPQGEVVTPLDEDEVRQAVAELKAAGVESIAVCFLFSFRNPAHEDRAQAIVKEEYPEAFVTTSASIFPQFREYERFTAACINAFVGPKVQRYVEDLEASLAGSGIGGELRIMRSNGGVATGRTAAEKPVTMLLSGPAAGVLAGAWTGALSDRKNLITFDVGGTSADIGLVTPRGFVEASARDTWVAGFPVMVPMIDIYTIGAGGGSIAYVDSGGAFRVGPKSAGANPGPACYGHGGDQPTSTDANVVLNRLRPDSFLGGDMKIHPELSHEAMSRLAEELKLEVHEAADGVVTILNHNMANAIRSRTIQKGHDPRRFTLVAFGGAGPLHAVEVAASLGIPEVIIPPYPGITSAMGLLTTDLKYDLIENEFMLSVAPDIQKLGRDIKALEAEGREQLRRDGVPDGDMEFRRGADCRYVGQGYELRVTIPGGDLDEAKMAQVWESFHEIHEAEYGHRFPANPIELVNLRVVAVGRMPSLEPTHAAAGGSLAGALVAEDDAWFRADGKLGRHRTRYYARERLPVGEAIDGPAIILQKDSTTVLPPGSQATLQDNGNILVKVG